MKLTKKFNLIFYDWSILSLYIVHLLSKYCNNIFHSIMCLNQIFGLLGSKYLGTSANLGGKL